MGSARSQGLILTLSVIVVAMVVSCGQTAPPEVPDPWVSGEASEQSMPNIVWVLLDAGRAENLSCYGYERPTTPFMDSLASRGVLFEQAFSQAGGTPWSVPSFLSGKYFPVMCLGQGGWSSLYRTVPDDELLLPEILRSNGYATATITAHPWFQPESRIAQAFDECIFLPPGPGENYADAERLNTVAFTWLAKNRQRPFFLYLHTLDTHSPYASTKDYSLWVDANYAQDPDATKPFSKEYRAYYRALYDGSLHHVDAAIGALQARFDALGLNDNTVWIVSSDHGECLGEDGENLHHPAGNYTVDELFHVPLIIAGPGLPAGKRVSALVENSDIVPTLVDLLELETHAQMDGKSLLPLLEEGGGVDSVHDYGVAHISNLDNDSLSYITLRNEDYRYEYRPAKGSGILWKVPDRLGSRVDMTDGDGAAVSAMHDYVLNNLMPLWERYAALPQTSPRIFRLQVSPLFAEPKDAFTTEADGKDNKWRLVHKRLFSRATAEDCPPISFHYEVPNGSYRIELELLPKKWGSAIAAKAEDDLEFKIVSSEDVQKKFQYADLGVYEIKDGVFNITLDDADRERNAYMSSFRFIPIIDGKEIVSSEDQDSVNEQLRALGYLD